MASITSDRLGWYGVLSVAEPLSVLLHLRYFFSTLLSLYNKWMFTPEYYGFSYPLFVTMCHQIVQFGLAFAVRRIFPSLRPKERPQKYDYMTKVVPTAATTGLDIGLSNLSLKTVTLTLYSELKIAT